MHCRTCGQQLNDQAAVCIACGVPPLIGKEFCQTCGAATNPAAVVCIKCGVPLAVGSVARSRTSKSSSAVGDAIEASDPPKDPVLMGVLSGCCIAGLGQILMGQTTKGIAIMIGSIVFSIVTMGFGILITWPAGGVDAYLIAKKLKEGKSVGQWEFF